MVLFCLVRPGNTCRCLWPSLTESQEGHCMCGQTGAGSKEICNPQSAKRKNYVLGRGTSSGSESNRRKIGDSNAKSDASFLQGKGQQKQLEQEWGQKLRKVPNDQLTISGTFFLPKIVSWLPQCFTLYLESEGLYREVGTNKGTPTAWVLPPPPPLKVSKGVVVYDPPLTRLKDDI